MQQYKVPILMILFNRPDMTQKVFDQIKKVKPKWLFIAADGAREHVSGEKKRCEEVKKIVEQIDWECEVKTLFQTKNLGLLYGPATAIDWFFQNVEEGIILEDDCMPNQSFFKFCEAMLERYRYDERVMHISGDNFQNGRKIGNGSYYFSKFNHVWGWASWRRAWKYFDVHLNKFPEFKKSNHIKNIWVEKEKAKVFNKIFGKVYKKSFLTWDYAWTFAIWSQGGLSILPNVNLVSNIGFGPQAMNTNKKTSMMAMPTGEIGEIIHPEFMNADYDADDFSFKNIYYSSFFKKVENKINQLLEKI